MKLIVSLFCILYTNLGLCQRVFFTRNKVEASKIVYFEKNSSLTNLTIRFTQNPMNAKNGRWYVEKDKRLADLIVYETKKRTEADWIIFVKK